MGKHNWPLQTAVPWPRLLLWSHVISVVGFYLVLWLRTAPGREDRVKTLPSGSENSLPSRNDPLVPIIGPARNEDRNIRRCVASLLETDYYKYSLTVIDHGSTAATPRSSNDP